MKEVDAGRFRVTVKVDAPVFYLSLDAEGTRGEFDDNCFALLPHEEKELVFTSKGAAPSAHELKKALTVSALLTDRPHMFLIELTKPLDEITAS